MANMLDHPHYTRPEVFEGQAVPPCFYLATMAK